MKVNILHDKATATFENSRLSGIKNKNCFVAVWRKNLKNLKNTFGSGTANEPRVFFHPVFVVTYWDLMEMLLDQVENRSLDAARQSVDSKASLAPTQS